MFSARQFGIDTKEGLLKTFMSNDWMHGVLVNHQIDERIKKLALGILMPQLFVSAGTLLYYQRQNVSQIKSICSIRNAMSLETYFAAY